MLVPLALAAEHAWPERAESAQELATWSLEEGWRSSGVRAFEPGRRFGALVRADREAAPEIEVRAGGDWLVPVETFQNDEWRVLVADLDGVATRAEVRVRGLEGVESLAWEVLDPVWEPVAHAPPPPSSSLTSAQVALGVVSRDTWGARATQCSSREDAWYRFAIHHTAGGITSSGSVQGAVQALQAYAQDSGEYCDIPYQFLVGYDGSLWEGREQIYQSGATGGGNNDGNVAVCYLGCFDSQYCSDYGEEVTEPMMAWGRWMVQTVAGEWGIDTDEDNLRGHRDWPGNHTVCPGDLVYARLDELRQPHTRYEAELVDVSWDGVAAPGEVWVELRNAGTSTWHAGTTWLAPYPRDQASGLGGAWTSPTRAATVPGDVAPGEVTRLTFTVGGAPQVQAFSLVEEGLTWFADRPYGGVTPDGFLTLELGEAEDSGAETGGGSGGESGAPDTDTASTDGAAWPGDPVSREAVAACGCATPPGSGAPGGAWQVVGVGLALGLGVARYLLPLRSRAS